MLIEAQLFTNPPFAQMTEHDPTARSGHEPTPPTELIITTEPEFPGQVVWECGSTLGIAPDEATARADAAAICQEVAAPAEPTDEAAVEAAAELIYMEAMEWAARQSIPSGHINIPAWQQGGNSDAQEVARRTARAVMSRFGHQPAPPADGEVAWLRAWARGTLEEGQPATSRSLTRAADLLERQAVPVPMAVSERLPGAEERDSDECCWWFYPETDDTLPVWVLSYGNDAWEIEKPPSPTHWLPAHTLPLPSGEVG